MARARDKRDGPEDRRGVRPRGPGGTPWTAAAGLLAVLCLAAPPASSALTLKQEPMPPVPRREAQGAVVDRVPDQSERYVIRERDGTDITPPAKAKPKMVRGKPPRRDVPRDMENLSKGWDSLGDGDAARALELFEKAAKSPDKLLAREAELGQAYSLWKLGREDDAEAMFKKLLDLGFRPPEVLPNLLFLLYKKGGPKAVEPYLHLLPETEREIWRK